MKWKRRTSRILYVVAAVIIGSALVYLFTLAGNKMKGPIENLLVNTENAVQKVEEKAILEQREYKRSDKLEWFAAYASNIAKLNILK